MKKTLLASFITILSATTVFSQNSPVILDITFDDNSMNICDGVYKYLTIKAFDEDGDALSIVDPLTFTNGFLNGYQYTAPTTDLDTTFFYFEIYTSGLVPANTVDVETITAMVLSGNVLDIPASATSTLADIQVNGYVQPTFTITDLYLCNNGLPIDISGYGVPSGGTYYWGTNWSSGDYSSSTALDPKVAYQYFLDDGSEGYGIDYQITNANGCQGYEFLNVEFYEAPEVVISVNNSNCLGATGSASAEINGGGIPYDVYWSTGYSHVSSGTSDILNLSSGVYYINVEDANGCKNVAKANVGDVGFAVTEDITHRFCAGNPGMIDLTVSAPGAVESIIWSNGATTEDITTGPGEYSVHILTDNNCNFFGTYTIVDSSLKVKLENYESNWSDCMSAPMGYFDITTSGGDGTYTWDWSHNGSFFSNAEDISNLAGGIYTCTVEDGSGCSLSWSKTISNYNNVYLYVNEVQHPTCGNTDGSIDVVIDIFGDVPSSYSWSNGATSVDLTGVAAGNYILTYADQAGCVGYLNVKLINEKPYQPTICLLTVDTSLIYNMVVWEKDPTQNIEGFNIYRETSTYSIFEKVAQRPYDLESFFQDNDASPVDRSWRYYLTTYDACGAESQPSFVHKTIHVVANTDDLVDYELFWDNYEGIGYSSIDLFRFDDVNGWTLVDNLPYGTNTYADTPPVISGLDYMVSFNLTDPCTSTKAQDHNSSRSNKTASVFNPGGSTAEIVDADLGYISIYPNPANSFVILHLDNPELFQTYEVLDLNGKVIATEQVLTNKNEIDLTNMANGIYMIRLVSDSKIIVEKFVKGE